MNYIYKNVLLFQTQSETKVQYYNETKALLWIFITQYYGYFNRQHSNVQLYMQKVILHLNCLHYCYYYYYNHTDWLTVLRLR